MESRGQESIHARFNAIRRNFVTQQGQAILKSTSVKVPVPKKRNFKKKRRSY